jgi:dihydroflavonol-4-reductase
MNSVFITGANGFIGSNLCRHFSAAGWEVHGLVRRTSDLHLLEGVDVRLVFGDLKDPASFDLPAGVPFVIHAASIVSDVADDETCRRNIFDLAVTLVGKVRAAAPPVRRIVFISTALTLGFGTSGICEERPGLSADFIPYTRYKILTERFLLDQNARSGLPVVILRPSDVIGPGDRTTCGRLMREGERGLPLIVGRGRCRFGFTFIGNLCRASELALLRDNIEGRSYTVTNGRLPTWGEFFRAVEAGFGKKQRLYVPAGPVFAVAWVMETVHKWRPSYEPALTYYRIKRITTETTYDISRTVAELGYVPDDDFERQVAETLAWYREERAHGHIH